VQGTVVADKSAGGVALTATISGLELGRQYIVDADPLPCSFFVGGPSQSFAHSLSADAAGKAIVNWTVPDGMVGNVNVQAVTSGGTFVVVACADST
jgi:hypothetical protein